MSHTQPQKPKLTPSRKRHLGRQIVEMWPLLVWIGMLFLVVWAYQKGGTFRQMNGTVGVYQEAVAPDETGRLHSVHVQPGDTVVKDQLLASMDTTLIDQEIARVRQEIEADWQDRIRRFEGDLASIQSDLADLELDFVADAAELEVRKSDLEQLEQDYAAGALPLEDIVDVRAKVGALEARTGRYKSVIGALEEREKSAAARLEELKNQKAETGADDAQQDELLVLETQKRNMELRAVHAGKVYRVEKEPGEIVRAGETVVRVVARPDNIVGFLPQEQVGSLRVNSQVWISSTADRHNFVESRIVAISPRMSSTPDRASPLPNKMLYGREVTIELPEEANLLPGQTVIIHVEKPGRLPFLGNFLQSYE